jgi:hypothetical protein
MAMRLAMWFDQLVGPGGDPPLYGREGIENMRVNSRARKWRK